MRDNSPRNLNPIVSVIISCYNYGKFVGDSIQSVLKQTHKNLEVIVVDDGSSDNTREVVKSFDDPRICYVYQENAGVNAVRNKGIRNAGGKYIAFVDVADLWLPQKLEKQLELCKKKPMLGLVYCLYSYFDSSTGSMVGFWREYKCKRGRVFKELYMCNFIGSPTPLMKKDVFDKVGFLETDNQCVDDYTMWVKIAYYYEIDYVPEILAKYRVHAGGSEYRPLDVYYRWLINFSNKPSTYFLGLSSLKAKRMSKVPWYPSNITERVQTEGAKELSACSTI